MDAARCGAHTAVRFDEAKRLAAEAYGYAIREPYDLEPEEEQHIGRYAKEVWGSDFVFVTHYPGRKRPFYTMDDPEDPRYTLSFDLLFRGMEITTGGQRIHNYGQQVEKIKGARVRMEPEDFSGYLLFHKHRRAAPRRPGHRPGAADHAALRPGQHPPGQPVSPGPDQA